MNWPHTAFKVHFAILIESFVHFDFKFSKPFRWYGTKKATQGKRHLNLTRRLMVDRIFLSMVICTNPHHGYNRIEDSLCLSEIWLVDNKLRMKNCTSLSFWILSGWSTEERSSSQSSGTTSIRFDKFRSTWWGGRRRIMSSAQSSWWSKFVIICVLSKTVKIRLFGLSGVFTIGCGSIIE